MFQFIRYLTQNYSAVTVLLSNNDSKNAEQSLLRGGSSCDEPLKMVSHGRCDGTDGADKVWSIFESNSGSSP